MKQAELSVETFEEITKTMLLVRCLGENFGREAGTKTTIHLYTIYMDFRDGSIEEILGELIYTFRVQSTVEPWMESTSALQGNQLGIFGSKSCRENIRHLMEQWRRQHQGSGLWLKNQPELACHERWGNHERWGEIPVSDFHLIQHYVRLHTQIAYAIRDELRADMTTHTITPSTFFGVFERRLWAFIRRQNALWEKTVGLLPQALTFSS